MIFCADDFLTSFSISGKYRKPIKIPELSKTGLQVWFADKLTAA
jgi:hypothetical protein